MSTKGAVELKVGERYQVQGTVATLQELHSDRAVLRPVDGGALLVVQHKVVEALPEPVNAAVQAFMQISQEDWDKRAAIRGELERIAQLPSGKTKALQEAAKKLGVGERQLFRLAKIYKTNPTVMALCSAKPGPKFGARRLDDEREQIIQRCIEETYLTAEKPTVAQLFEAIEAACREADLEVPSITTVRTRVKAIELDVRVRRREGGKRARELCEGAPGHLEVEAILQRIEIDHTLIDVILRADTPEREVIGRPWLTVAIDCKSRMIVGFYVSFERPSAESVAMCLAMAALPKAEWLAAMGIVGAWPAEGIPLQIWLDNAMEFRSEALRRGCEQYQIQLCFRPVGSPQVGGTIERLIGTLMAMVHLLPGTTQSNIAARGEYDAGAKAVMTLSEFIPWFCEQVVSRYHLSVHRGIGMPPLKAWEQGAITAKIRKARDAMEYYASFLPGDTRKLTRTGVQMHTVNYWSDHFSPWIGRSKTVTVHYHRMDVYRVYVRLPDGTMTVAKADREDVKGLTLDDLRRRNGDKRLAGKAAVLTEARHEGYRRNRERLEAAQKATSKALRGASAPKALPAPEVPMPPMQRAFQPFDILLID